MPHYREVLYRDYSANFGGARALPGAGAGEEAFAAYAQVYGPHLPADRDVVVADLGCGRGSWLRWLLSLGYTDLRGIDVSGAELADCPEIPVEEGDVTEVLGRSSQAFDLLFAKDVLEHLDKQECVDLMLQVKESLKPGGEIWITTFNGQALFASSTHFADFTHESAHTPNSLAQLLRACGLEVVSVRGLHATPGLKGAARRLIWKTANLLLRPVRRSRHGGGSHAEGVETDATAPDLLAIGRRPAVPSTA